MTGEEKRQAYSGDGYVLLKELFPPLVLAVFHGKLQSDLKLKDNPNFLSHTPLLTKPAIEVYSRQYAPMATFHWGLTPAAAAIGRRHLRRVCPTARPPRTSGWTVEQHGS